MQLESVKGQKLDNIGQIRAFSWIENVLTVQTFLSQSVVLVCIFIEQTPTSFWNGTLLTSVHITMSCFLAISNFFWRPKKWSKSTLKLTRIIDLDKLKIFKKRLQIKHHYWGLTPSLIIAFFQKIFLPEGVDLFQYYKPLIWISWKLHFSFTLMKTCFLWLIQFIREFWYPFHSKLTRFNQ